MESLGFDEAPFESSDRASREAPSTAGSSEPRPSSTTVTTLKGKHTKHGVEGLWDTTTFDAPSLADWRPQDIGKLLRRRRIRRTPVILTILIVVALTFFGYWLYRQPSEQAASAEKTVASHAVALSSSLDTAEELTTELVSGTFDADYTTELGMIDDIARELFGASASLEESSTEHRTLAANSSSRALADTQRIREAAAYRLALGPALVMPAFETDPNLITIQEATLAFGEWRASLDEVADLLPTSGNDVIDNAFSEFRESVQRSQRDYVDAIASNDGFEANRVLLSIQADIAAFGETVGSEYQRLAADIRSSITTTREDLARLVG